MRHAGTTATAYGRCRRSAGAYGAEAPIIMNSPSAKFTMPVMPNVSVMPSAMIPYMAPMMAPFRTCPRTSCVTRLLRIDRGDLDGAALLQPHHVEIEDRLALLVEAEAPHALVRHAHQLLLHRRGIVDGARLLHRFDEHVDVVVAGRGAERRLVVGEVALVERLVGRDELLDLRVLLLGLLEVLRHVYHVLVEAVLVLQARAERAAHEEELLQLSRLRRLAHDVVEVRIGVAREEIDRLPRGDLGEHRREVLRAGLEVVDPVLDALLLEHRDVY